MKWLFALCLWAPLLASDAARIVYTKQFPGSVPAYIRIEVAKDGKAVYKEALDDDAPANFQLAAEDTAAIFALSDKLERFKRPLESNLKVANMGMKTFRMEDGAEKNEVKFNYSLDEDAKTLQDIFERITETQQYLFGLERSVRFDKLGVNKSLLQLESAYHGKRIVGPERFLPLLERVIKNESYLHMARERAAALAELFRPEKAKAE